MQVKDALTERELELVKLAALGMKNRHIGWRLGISEGWVRHRFTMIFDKTGTWSRLEVVTKWVWEQAAVPLEPATPVFSLPTRLLRPSFPESSSQTP